MSVSAAIPKSPTDGEATSGGYAEAHMKDDALYDQLIAPMESRMMRTIWRVVRQKDLAEDTLQDALAVIWRKRARVRRHPNPQALILKICLNCAYDTMRKRQRFQNLRESSRVEPTEAQQLEDAAEELAKKELESQVVNAISRLPQKQAVAVLMRIVQDESYETIAKAMGCSESTVRIHVSRGRKRLSRWLSHIKTGSIEEPRNE